MQETIHAPDYGGREREKREKGKERNKGRKNEKKRLEESEMEGRNGGNRKHDSNLHLRGEKKNLAPSRPLGGNWTRQQALIVHHNHKYCFHNTRRKFEAQTSQIGKNLERTARGKRYNTPSPVKEEDGKRKGK